MTFLTLVLACAMDLATIRPTTLEERMNICAKITKLKLSHVRVFGSDKVKIVCSPNNEHRCTVGQH